MKWMIVTDSSCDLKTLEGQNEDLGFETVPFVMNVDGREFVDEPDLNVTELVDAMEKAVGTPLRGKDGALDRKRLAGIIFSDSSAREKVEAVVYPAVLADFKRWKSRQKGAPFVVLESAVALSKPIFDALAQAVVLVDAPPEVRLARVMRRDSLDAEAVMRRMAAQRIPMDRVDVILSNDGDVQALSAAVSRVFFEENSYLCKILNQSK